MPNNEQKINDLQSEIQTLKTALEQFKAEFMLHEHNGVSGTRVDFDSILGNIGTTGTVPTHVPRDISEQIVFYSSSTTYRIYWYDFIGKAWRYTQLASFAISTTAKVFSGQVNSGGTSSSGFPSGWSVTKNTTGQYTVTHSLATTEYTAVACVQGGVAKIASPVNLNSNTFDVYTFSTALAAQDNPFNFVLTIN